MGEEDSDKPVVGGLYRGSEVVHIDEEHSTRPNGLVRVRRSIQLKTGMILLEDEFKDPRKIEGEYKEVEYKEVPSPRGIKLPVDAKKKKKKPAPTPLLDDDKEEKSKREAEAKAKREAEEAARKAKEARELKEAREQAIKKEAELRAKKEADLRAQKEADERARKEEEERLRQEENRRRKELEEERQRQFAEEERQRELEKQRQRHLEDDGLRASQEAARKRKEEADLRREVERKAKEAERSRAAMRDKWAPQSMLAYSPQSNIRREDEARPETANNAVWSYAPGYEPDPDFDWWKPQSVIVHPPGKPLPISQASDDTGTPHGLWAYSPGTQPDDDDDEWNPQGGTTAPQILLFPPGVKPTAGNKELKVQGEWSYPPGETNFPPLPTPKNEWGPKIVKVYPKSKSPTSENGAEDSNAHGVWMIYDGDGVEPLGEDDWRISEIQVFPEGQEPKDINDSTIRGVWGLAPGAKPDENGEWNAESLWFFGPGNPPPNDEDWNPQGTWVHSPEAEREDWPPISEPQDEWGPRAIWVYPPSKVPEDDGEDWQATGVWNFGDKGGDEAEEWNPYQVTVHPKGQEPENLEDYKIHGVWGLSPGAERDDDGNWKASDLWFMAPGEEGPEDWRPQGVWTVSPENVEDEGEDWPPKHGTTDSKAPESQTDSKSTEPQIAVVYPSSKASSGDDESALPHGVWAFGNSSDDEEPDWMPQHVLLHKTGTEADTLDSSTPHGAYGYAPGAQPDLDGNYDPSDMWFFMPGEDPPSDSEWNPAGIWTVPPGEQSIEFPPAKSNATVRRSQPRKVIVYPKKKAPKDIEKGVSKGVWSYSPGKKVMDSGKKPIEVDLYEKGQEPGHLPKAHGVWGYAPGAQPNCDGDYLAEDMWLFAPGETPPNDSEWQPHGVWSEPPPPPKKSIPKAQNFSGGKMKEAAKEKKPRKRRFEKSAWVYPTKAKAPSKGEKKNPEGCWTKSPGGSEDDEPQEILLHAKGHEPKDADKLPHGAWGYAPGSQPDDDGVWSPKDMLFYPPGETPPPDVQNQGVWTYPHGSRIEITTSYRYEGDDIIYMKKTEIFYMDTVISFYKEQKGK